MQKGASIKHGDRTRGQTSCPGSVRHDSVLSGLWSGRGGDNVKFLRNFCTVKGGSTGLWRSRFCQDKVVFSL